MDGRIVTHPEPNVQPAAGVTSIFQLQKGKSYREFNMYVQSAVSAPLTIAQLRNDVELVKVVVNSRTKWEITGDELLDLTWAYYGHLSGFPLADIGLIPIFFVPFHYKSPELAEGLALGMAGLESAQIEVKWAAGLVTAAKITARPKVGPNHAPGNIRCIRRSIRNQAATGWEDRDSLKITFADRLVVIHTTLGATPGVIDAMDFLINGDSYLNYRSDELLLAIAKGTRHKVAGWNHMDFALRSMVQDTIAFGGIGSDPAARNVKVDSASRRLEWSVAPGAYVEVDERIEPAVAAQ